MKQCKVCKNIKALSAFYEHSSCNQGVRPECKLCTLKAQNEKLTPEKKQKKLAYCKQWNKNNKERVKQSNKIKYTSDKNGFKNRAKTYKLAKAQRIPNWLTVEDFKQINELYNLSYKLTAETGIVHHVDHIIPLRGEIVSGLHVPNNLRIITAAENLSKKNKVIF